MSLESEIKSLRTSIDKLVEVLSSLPAQPTSSSSSSSAAAASSPAAANQAAPAPSTQQAAEPVAEPADAQTFDYQKDIKPRVLKLGETNMDALLALFKEFGVAKAPELKPEQYAAFIEKIDAILAGKATAQQTESLV